MAVQEFRGELRQQNISTEECRTWSAHIIRGITMIIGVFAVHLQVLGLLALVLQ